MSPRVLVLWGFLIPSAITISYAADKVDYKDLSDEGKRVVQYLKKDWKERFRSTTIPWAMRNLGLEPDDGMRLKIGQYFRDHPGLIRNLRFWGANNYILSDEEKLIAKFLINSHEKEGSVPDVEESTHALGISEKTLKARLAFMSQAGLLQESENEELGYALAEGHKRWGGPLRHNFHTVHVEGEKPFGVW